MLTSSFLRTLFAGRSADPTVRFVCGSTRDATGRVRVSPVGEVDVATAPELDAALMGAQTGQPSVVVLDLSGVSFLDSAGAHVVIDATRRAHEQGSRVVTVGSPHHVNEVFRLTGTAARINTEDEIASRAGEQAPA